MPSLAGLFGRKNKSSTNSRSNGHETDSALSSPVADYVTPDKSLPSSPNGKSPLHPDRDHSSIYPSIATSSTSRLKLPFGRKKPAASASSTSVVTTYTASQDSSFSVPPRPPYLYNTSSSPRNSSSAASDSDHDPRRLRPPPSKSAIFAAYGDPNGALSTRSLPNEPSSATPLTITTSSPSSIPPPVPPKNPPKKTGFFQWSRSTPSSPQHSFTSNSYNYNNNQPPSQPLSPVSPTKSESAESSFNLKSFRHVGQSPNGSNTSLPQPVPRPRGMSTNSDSSQRISVAAFREAQARRSTAGSPVPSNRAPSPGPAGGLYAPTRPGGQQHSASAPAAVPQKGSYSGGNGNNNNNNNRRNKRSSMLAYASDSTEDESEEEEDEDVSSDEQTMRGRGGGDVRRRRTLTKRRSQPPVESPTSSPTKLKGGRATKSEVGHGQHYRTTSPSPAPTPTHLRRDFTPAPRSQSSLMSYYTGQQNDKAQEDHHHQQPQPQPRSQSSLGFNGSGQQRPRASVSTSALTPSAAAQRASVLASANSDMANVTTSANTKRHSRALSAHNVPVSILSGSSAATTIVTHIRRPAKTHASSSSSSSSDSDDAPLATLVPPRRPGSALSSNNSHSSLRSAAAAGAGPKPLIDINELTNGRPKPVKGNSLNVGMEGFTGGSTLLSKVAMTGGGGGGGGGGSGSPAHSNNNNSTANAAVLPKGFGGPVQTSVDPPTKFVSPPSSPLMGEKRQLPTNVGNKGEIVRLPPQPSALQQQEGMRGVPVRRETSPAVVGGAGAGEDSSGRKDALGERLARVVQMKSGPDRVSSNTTMTTTTVKLVSASAPALSAPQTKAKTTTRSTSKQVSPPDEDLASLLGAGVQLIHRTGDSESETEDKNKNLDSEQEDEESSSSSSSSDDDSDSEDGYTKIEKEMVDGKKLKEKGKGRDKQREPESVIAPIPIKERAPQPAFSVTSRPPLRRPTGDTNAKWREVEGELGGGDRTSVASTNFLSQIRGEQTVKPVAATTTTSTATMMTSGMPRQRSATLVPSSSSSVSGSTSPTTATRPGILNLSSQVTGKDSFESTSTSPGLAPRQRSTTLLPDSITSPTATSSSSSSSTSASNHKAKSAIVPVAAPARPFAAARRNSPASSTGDSSSGRAPFTPKDGSDVGFGHNGASTGGWSGGVSGLTVKGRHIKRRSVTFGDDLIGETAKAKASAKEEKKPEVDAEERRKERRRGEAKAAIELGNVINGRGPVIDDDDDDDLPINQTLAGGAARMSAVNPMMAMGTGGMPMGFGSGMGTAAAPGWNMNLNPAMVSPAAQFIPSGGADPNFLAAHQQAMMYAKQAYQMAVAQQAMAAAGDEWERGSTIGGFGSGGSVYGGATPSIVGSPFAMSPMMNMNMNMGMGMGMQSPGAAWSSAGSVIFPPSSRSMYGGISGARSEYGGGGGRAGGQWSSSKSSYGESFGPSSGNRHSKAGRQRESGYFPPVPPIPQQHASGSPSKGDSSRSRTTSQPANPGRGVRKIPPSSWKASGA